MIRTRTAPSRPSRRRGERRGFVFVLLLLVVFAAAAMIAWGTERVSTEALMVQKRIEGYHRHHEMLGVRDLVLNWMVREVADNKLSEFAKSGEVTYRVVLPGRVVVLVRVRDGQGTIRTTVDPNDRPEVAERLLDVINYLPENRPDLLRRHGAIQVSVAGAEPEVIRALARGNAEVEAALIRIRESPTVDRSNFFQELQRAGVPVEEVQALADMIVFDQNRLWRVDVEVVDSQSVRRYTGLVQAERNLTRMLEWGEDVGPVDAELDPETEAEVGLQSRRS